MDNDDRQVGQILSRRDALKLLGLTSAAVLTGCAPALTQALETETAAATTVPAAETAVTRAALPACVVRPEMTEGPYYVDEGLNRSDIRSDPSTGAVSEGAPLTLTFNVSQIAGGGCTPLEAARVDVWHCDAQGAYSDVSDPGFSTQGQKFLRGHQATDANGQATFVTIYPGWYPGRTVHIHFKVFEDSSGQGREFTSQLFFDDAFTDQVFIREPYAARGQRNTLNAGDGIYDDRLLLEVVPANDGYAATFDIGLELS